MLFGEVVLGEFEEVLVPGGALGFASLGDPQGDDLVSGSLVVTVHADDGGDGKPQRVRVTADGPGSSAAR